MFLLKCSITVHRNRLVLEQRTKTWMTVLSSKLQNKQSEVLCLRKKEKAFWYRLLYKLYVENIVT